METTVPANEIFADTRADYWPIHLCDVLQAETLMSQCMDFNLDSGGCLESSPIASAMHNAS